jgi:PadR family transcriptional regulator
MANPPLDLLLGTLDVLILRTLAWEPMHGYAISRWIRERSAGQLAVQDAALYKALRRLEERGAVRADWGVTDEGRRARYYRLNAAGRRELERGARAFRTYATVIFQVLEPMTGERVR